MQIVYNFSEKIQDIKDARYQIHSTYPPLLPFLSHSRPCSSFITVPLSQCSVSESFSTQHSGQPLPIIIVNNR